MAENPFDPKSYGGLLAALSAEPHRNSLLDFVAPPTSKPEINLTNALAGMFAATPPSTPFGSLGGFLASPPIFAPAAPQTRPFSSLADVVAPPARSPFNTLYTPPQKLKPVEPETKRKAFFSFHFDDIMRVNNVRNGWKITHPDSALNRSFYDSSLWEARKLIDPEGIKQLIRVGVLRTSVVCVLAGSMTWDRRWVKYEIARAIIDGRGLLTVHLNNINHHKTRGAHPLGRNPLAHIGIAKLRPNKHLPPKYYIYEMALVPDGNGGLMKQWKLYSDYTLAVKKPVWLTDPDVGYVMPLSTDAAEHDYELEHGHRNIGSWIDDAAKQAGR